MTAKSMEKPPVWFWIVSIVALLWNLMGVLAYLQQAFMTEEALAALSEPERLLLETRPAWATAAFALAVWGGLLGCVALLLRKKWARPVLIISLIGILVQMIHSFFISKNLEVYGPGEISMPILIILIGVGLVFFARIATRKLWLG
ncbi:hypothetical protein [Ulvibacterium marinum]|uniref:Sugar transporter n=1 Tax=Ulvibacterium marinum TaxID=2419782 RepID=A0A3B0C4W6_9FLAO|nr:hypothetical protein [Ulvibacterium marinum]RKN81023.1 hypothetical protein D7Z94_08715 [Ulvibacterium marinum]